MFCKFSSKKGIILAELILGLAFMAFVVYMGSLLFTMSAGNIGAGQGNAISHQEARSFEIMLREALSKATDMAYSQNSYGDFVFSMEDTGLTAVSNGKSETFSSVTKVELTAAGVASAYQAAPGSVLRYRMDYKITAQNRQGTYILNGGILLNDISRAGSLFSGSLGKTVDRETAGFVNITLEG